MKKIFFTVLVSMLFTLSIAAQAMVISPPGNDSKTPPKIIWTAENRINTSSPASATSSEETFKITGEKLQGLEQKHVELKNQIQEKIANLKAKIDAKREELKNTIEQKKTQLESKLKNLRDQGKAKIVLNIQSELAKLNNGMVDHFSDVLDRLEKVLTNIKSREAKAAAAGKDVTATSQAIADAQKAIDSARAAVELQSSKIYTITLSASPNGTSTSSSTASVLKIDVGKTRKALHDDLMAVQKMVFAAREAVHKAAQALAQITGVDDIEKNSLDNATSTPNNGTSTQD